MYKRFKSEKYDLSFETFPVTAKNVSKVYHTGIRNWTSDDSYNYSLVMGTFRVILSRNQPKNDCSPL